jgi:hypothetical protein
MWEEKNAHIAILELSFHPYKPSWSFILFMGGFTGGQGLGGGLTPLESL